MRQGDRPPGAPRLDLAVPQHIPIKASQRASWCQARISHLRHCVIIDHGLGVQTLYRPLSSIGVKVGDKVEKGQQIGISGRPASPPATTSTSRARQRHAGESGRMWDPKWMQDRVFRKVTEAGARYPRDIIDCLETLMKGSQVLRLLGCSGSVRRCLGSRCCSRRVH